jgi:hypothetical protein
MAPSDHASDARIDTPVSITTDERAYILAQARAACETARGLAVYCRELREEARLTTQISRQIRLCNRDQTGPDA